MTSTDYAAYIAAYAAYVASRKAKAAQATDYAAYIAAYADAAYATYGAACIVVADADANAAASRLRGSEMTTTTLSLYAEMLAAGLVTGNYESDLHVQDTPDAWAIYEKHKGTMASPQRFRDNITGLPSLDFYFEYVPYWDALNARIAARIAALKAAKATA